MDFKKKLETAHDKVEKVNVEVMKYCWFFKHIQCHAENKIMYLMEEFNKEMKEWIACNDISNGERKDLEVEKYDKKFLALFSVLEF